MRKVEKRTETLSFTAEPDLRKKIEEMAEREQRTLSQQLRKLVLEGLATHETADDRKRPNRPS